MTKATETGIVIQSDNLVNRTDLCIIFNITPGTLEKWCRNGLSRHKRNGSRYWMYNISEVLEFRVQHERKLAEDEIKRLRDKIRKLEEESEEGGSLSEYKLMDLRAKAEIKELELREKRKELISYSEVYNRLGNLGLLFRHHIEDEIKKKPKLKSVLMSLVNKYQRDIDRIIKEYDNDYAILDEPEEEESEYCIAKTGSGKPCKNKAKQENLCMIHWKQLKMK